MTKRRTRKLIDGMIFWMIMYPLGILLGLLFQGMKITGRVRIKHFERFPAWKGRLIVASNHESLWEPWLLPFLLFRQYLFHPQQFIPWITTDLENYVQKRHYFWIRSRLIAVPRGRQKGEFRAVTEMVKMLRGRKIVILFPEGGRTYKGKKFLYSPNGKRIRELKHGIGDLVIKAGATVVPVWVEGSERILPNTGWWLSRTIPRIWFPATIKIGPPMRWDNHRERSRREVTESIAHALLELADEEG